MANTLKVAPALYSQPPKTALGGVQMDYREVELLGTDVESTTQLVAIGVLPAGHRLLDAFIETDDLDDGANLTITVGILNTYYNEPAATAAVPADYDSGGATNTGTAPALVSGQDLFTTDTVGQAGGRKDISDAALTPCLSIGVDYEKDRVIAVQFPTGAAGGSGNDGTLGLGILIGQA